MSPAAAPPCFASTAALMAAALRCLVSQRLPGYRPDSHVATCEIYSDGGISLSVHGAESLEDYGVPEDVEVREYPAAGSGAPFASAAWREADDVRWCAFAARLARAEVAA